MLKYLSRTITGDSAGQAASALVLLDDDNKDTGANGVLGDLQFSGTATNAVVTLTDQRGVIFTATINPSTAVPFDIDDAEVKKNLVSGKVTVTIASISDPAHTVIIKLGVIETGARG